jgi:hypothetical protein
MIAFHETLTHGQIHAANVAAVTIPVMSIMLHAPIYFAAGTGLMSFIYYSMVVFDKILDYRKRWKGRDRG